MRSTLRAVPANWTCPLFLAREEHDGFGPEQVAQLEPLAGSGAGQGGGSLLFAHDCQKLLALDQFHVGLGAELGGDQIGQAGPFERLRGEDGPTAIFRRRPILPRLGARGEQP